MHNVNTVFSDEQFRGGITFHFEFYFSNHVKTLKPGHIHSQIVGKTNDSEQGSEKYKADVVLAIFNGGETLPMPLQGPFMASFNPI